MSSSMHKALAIFFLATFINSCNALVMNQSRRTRNLGYHRYRSYANHPSTSRLFLANKNILESNKNRAAVDLQKLYRMQPVKSKEVANDDTDTDINNHGIICNQRFCNQGSSSPHQLIHSFALVATVTKRGRQLSFLLISMTLVNFVRSSIFKVSMCFDMYSFIAKHTDL